MGRGAPRLVTFRPRERIRSVRRASAALQIERHEREPGRDPLAELGLGASWAPTSTAWMSPRACRRATCAARAPIPALKSLGARWL